MVKFVSFYIKPSKLEAERFETTYKLTHRGTYEPADDPDKILTLMFASAKRFHPDASLCLLTDERSKFKLHPSIEIMRYPRRSDELDMEMLYALIHYLKENQGKDNTIFLEWDQLVQGHVSNIFIGKADLYFAYRRIPPVPIDDAFIAIGSGPNYKEKIDFFEVILQQYDHLPSNKLRYWLGKSLIFSLMMFEPMLKAAMHKKIIHGFEFKNLYIRILDGKKYSRKVLWHEITKFIPDALVLHFSNKKKRKIKEYWHKFLPKRPKEPSKPPPSK